MIFAFLAYLSETRRARRLPASDTHHGLVQLPIVSTSASQLAVLHQFLTRVKGCGVLAIQEEELLRLTEGGLGLEEGLPEFSNIGCIGT